MKSSIFNFWQKLLETGSFILKKENFKELQLKHNLLFFSEIVQTCSRVDNHKQNKKMSAQFCRDC